MSQSPKIFVLHENQAWVEPLVTAFESTGAPVEFWYLDGAHLPLDEVPPEGIYYNRVSASSYTRDHAATPELTRNLLRWLEGHGRTVINDTRALDVELSKLHQYHLLRKVGIRVPRTHAAVGRTHMRKAAEAFASEPFIVKPNRGGKGAGVHLFQDLAEFDAWLADTDELESGDGIWLIQQYIASSDGAIVRNEFVGGRHLYSVRVDTRAGFELCPADVCNADLIKNRFQIIDAFDDHPLLTKYEAFLKLAGVDIAGIEMVSDGDGVLWTYDVNTNTNYNSMAEAHAAVPQTGMQAVATYLASTLKSTYTAQALTEAP